jgi:hypothetical protein
MTAGAFQATIKISIFKFTRGEKPEGASARAMHPHHRKMMEKMHAHHQKPGAAKPQPNHELRPISIPMHLPVHRARSCHEGHEDGTKHTKKKL